MTTTTTVPTFSPASPAETPADYARRALLFILANGDYSTWRLDDASLEAALWASGTAQTARGISDVAVARLTGLQRHLGAILAARLADAKVAAEVAALPVAPVPPAAGGKPGGGQRVARPVPPVKPVPPAGGAVPPQLQALASVNADASVKAMLKRAALPPPVVDLDLF